MEEFSTQPSLITNDNSANSGNLVHVPLVETCSTPCNIKLVNPYKTSKATPLDLVSLAREIQTADSFVHANVSNKLQVIAEQVRFLQEQARKVLQEAKENYNLHHVACNFVKKPGCVYYLYKRPTGQLYFSMISPKEWGSSCPHEYIGAFRLEIDQSWTPEEKFEEKAENQQLINKILNCTNTLSITIGK